MKKLNKLSKKRRMSENDEWELNEKEIIDHAYVLLKRTLAIEKLLLHLCVLIYAEPQESIQNIKELNLCFSKVGFVLLCFFGFFVFCFNGVFGRLGLLKKFMSLRIRSLKARMCWV